MELFPIDLHGKICADIGASTGGFTDCMLQNGASKVYAMDVGYGQLAWKLRSDPRVVNMEKCNVRYLDPALVPDPIDFISVDVSFISLKLIFPTAAKIIRKGGQMVCLVKPQFEAGREQMRGTGGIVRDPEIHKEVIRKAAAYAVDNGFTPKGLTFSPVKGTKGNIEYLLYIEYNNESENLGDIPVNSRYNETTVESIVRQSHEDL
jgi:23S rRNA (cytidine1920-2'-O)/16S rRNA (cytidine1409-2'-O)-methyltransferase